MADEIAASGPWQEQREHTRLESLGIPWLRSARLTYGPHVEVLDLSASGILFQSEQALQPGQTVVIEISGPMGTVRAAATVQRCRLVLCGEMTRVQIACVFKQQLQLSRAR